MNDIKEQLREPFPQDLIKFRAGSGGKMLAYVTAHQVEQRLDNVVGWENWQCEYYDVAGKVYCKIGILINNTTDDADKASYGGKNYIAGDANWVWKSDCGSETGFAAEKGQASDAFKRAAKKFGIGRHLWLNPPTFNKQ